jgi:glycosyltransferase involved in cell wall biosynthesis
MRILRVAQKIYPDHVGGGPYHVHALSRDQARAGHDVTVLTVGTGDGRPRVEERAGYTVVRKSSTVTALGNDISLGVARYLLTADEFDIVHAHSHLYFSTNLAALNRVVGGTPLAVTNHGLYSQQAPEWLFDAYLKTLGRATFDAADLVFCYTGTDRRQVRELGVSTAIQVVENGIDNERFSPDGDVDTRLGSDRQTALFAGRLVDGKRPQVSVDAITELVGRGVDVELVVCGDGPLMSTLRSRVTGSGVSDRVDFLGNVEYDRMPDVYRGADVLLLPSDAEGFPRTVMEALASGVPAVTSDLDQVAEIVDQAGRTVSSERPAAYADAIESLLGDEREYRERVERGIELVADRFRWQDTVSETTDALSSLCSE